MVSGEQKELQDQVALITGAAGAIGRAISDGFLQAGACVALVDIDQARLEEFKQKLFTVQSELSSGGSIENPGQIQEYKKAIARLQTIMTELDEI